MIFNLYLEFCTETTQEKIYKILLEDHRLKLSGTAEIVRLSKTPRQYFTHEEALPKMAC